MITRDLRSFSLWRRITIHAMYATKAEASRKSPSHRLLRAQSTQQTKIEQQLKNQALLRKQDGGTLKASSQSRSNKNRGPSPETEEQLTVSEALRDAKADENNLLSPIHIPEDPNGVLKENHPVNKILRNSAIVIQRQLEVMNLVLGFEQANKYVIMDPQGNHIGYMAEQELGMGNMMARQWFRTHRSFTTHIFDREMKEVLRFHRPFSWISSRIRVYDPQEVTSRAITSATALQTTAPGTLTTETTNASSHVSPLSLSEMRVIGEAQQQWAPLRRKYNLFLSRNPSNPRTNRGTQPISSSEDSLPASQRLQIIEAGNREAEFEQFAYVDEPFLSWDFSLLSADSRLIGSVNRNFAGFGREVFTDTGVYALRMDAAGLAEEPDHLISKTGAKNPLAYDKAVSGMTLDQRAVMLATAVSVDFDYFSRRRGGAMGFMPLWFPGGEAAAEGAAAEGAAAEGAAAEGAAEGAAAEGSEGGAFPGDTPGQAAQTEEVWGEELPWGDGNASAGGGSNSDLGRGSGEGSGGIDIGDWF